MAKLLLITPPFTQLNCPYPATAYLKGYLRGKGYDVEQYDLSIELIDEIFTAPFLEKVFDNYRPSSPSSPANDANLQRIYALRRQYITTIDAVMDFLRGTNPELSPLICGSEFLPQASRFETAQAVQELDYFFGTLGNQDCAKYLCTLYLQDLSDFLRATVSRHFELVRYGEQIALSIPSFSKLEPELAKPLNLIEKRMIDLLEEQITIQNPEIIGFSVPFPGNLLSALRCAQYIKSEHPAIKTAMGGGYPSTELRHMTDKAIFDYFDYILLDDGELPLERILSGGELSRTYTKEGYHSGGSAASASSELQSNSGTPQPPGAEECYCSPAAHQHPPLAANCSPTSPAPAVPPRTHVTHAERGCPDFSGLPHKKYISLTEVTNPMHRLWSDGRWNKMMLAHGCYWARCAFCDTSLDYICRYDTVPAAQTVDWMERIMRETGSRGFHFVDEAAPPKLLKELSLEILRRSLKVTWWTNIRFESAFTGDLALLMAAAGCVAVSGGLETASDRLLEAMNKGITIEQATITMRNFFYAGIMVHTYLMYGFPTQTFQESVDALEVVRQMFRAELISSAFWHRYAMTIHSPLAASALAGGIGTLFRQERAQSSECSNPAFSSTRAAAQPSASAPASPGSPVPFNPFANNEIAFTEHRNYNINMVGEALRESLANYMYGNAIDRPADKWFKGRDIPRTAIENSLITDHLIKPDRSRIYDETARLVWIGSEPERTPQGLTLCNGSGFKSLKFDDRQSEFLFRIMSMTSDLSREVTFSEAAEIYREYSEEPLVVLFLSKKWDAMRTFGLLKI